MTDRPRALAVLIAVFLVGGISGAAGSYYWLKQDTAIQSHHREEGPPGVQGRRRLPELLQLTPEQDARFREIMVESRKQLEQLWKRQEPLQKQLDGLRNEQFPKVEAIRAETNRKFLAILNPEQQKQFNAFLKEREGMRDRMPRGRGFETPPRPEP
jgi:Spy/CpxP family protein refolding chaperone